MLDIEQPEQLVAYMRRARLISEHEQVATRVLAGGVSNRTVLVERPDGTRWVIKQALAKLRVAVDWFSDPARIEREALALRWLSVLAPPGTITPLVFGDPEQHIVGMAAVAEPHENWKTMLLDGMLAMDHVEQFGRLLGAIHRHAAERRAEVEPIFADQSFFESLRVEPYYGYTADQVPESAVFYASLIADTRAHRHTLVHGDYSPKNVLVHHGKLVLLDHEVIHFGDPAFDLGFSLTHFLSKAHHLPGQREAFAAAALHYWLNYTLALGTSDFGADLEARVVRHTLGCLLARVAGRSPLEYLDATEQQRQQAVVVTLMLRLPESVTELVRTFVSGLERCYRRSDKVVDEAACDSALDPGSA